MAEIDLSNPDEYEDIDWLFESSDEENDKFDTFEVPESSTNVSKPGM